MIILRFTFLEVYETPQSGFFFDYNNDETWTINDCKYIRIDVGERDVNLDERERAREKGRDKEWSFMFVSLFRSSVVIDRVVLLSLGFMWLCLFWNCWLDLLFFVLSSFYWVVAAFIVVHEIKTVLFSDFYKQLGNQ